MARSSRWLIFAPVAILTLFSSVTNAEPIQGLNTTYYTIDEIPPAQSTSEYPVCGSELENNINRSYDGEPYLDCTNDLFMVHMTGFIEIPVHDTIEFWLATDDGGNINIDGNEWGNWGDQGCSATESGPLDISAGNAPLDLWMYENGGGTCLMLAWNIDNTGWVIVPEEAFLTSGVSTTTTIQETTTSWESTTTSTTTTTTTSTIAQSTTVLATTVPISTIPQTTYTIPVEPTMPDPPATVPLPQIFEPATLETMPLPPEIETNPPETLNLPPEIVDTMPDVVDTYPTVGPPYTLPFVGELPGPPDTMPEPPPTLPIELIAELPPELVQALEDAGFTDIPLTEEEFTTAVEAIADLGTEEAVALIEQILNTAVTSEQATELASNPDVLAVVTSEQAEEIFATIDVTELDNTQIEELIAAVQSAPTKVRKAFEKTINVFGDGLGNYVPIGSNVPVHTRRTLIAVAAGATTVAAGQRRRK